MIPDYLIIEEIRRRRENTWEPEPLPLPLYEPPVMIPESRQPENNDEVPNSGVIIIDMNID